MKVAQINVTCGAGSTGKISVEISKLLSENGIENYILYSSGSSEYPLGIKYTNEKYIKCQALLTRLNGKYGFNSCFATKRLIKELEKIQPDVIHLHNVHGHNCNLEILFQYIRKNKIKVIWTFHDCWAFTGYCPHFTMAKCSKWKKTCLECSQRKRFSWFFDKSNSLFEAKKSLLDGINMTVVTPSRWLSNLTKESFFRNCDIKVINNGIDLSIFKPRESNFKEKYNIPENKKIILGVAFGWGMRKGLDIFKRLAKELDSTDYQIVLVGTNPNVEKELSNNMISIRRTNNQLELAEIYSAADLFVNATREDTFPTVNIEALACGTPVLTFETGGSPEIIDNTCGSVVAVDDFEQLKKEIISICEESPYTSDNCVKRAQQFNQDEKFEEYYKIYEQLL